MELLVTVINTFDDQPSHGKVVVKLLPKLVNLGLYIICTCLNCSLHSSWNLFALFADLIEKEWVKTIHVLIGI